MRRASVAAQQTRNPASQAAALVTQAEMVWTAAGNLTGGLSENSGRRIRFSYQGGASGWHYAPIRRGKVATAGGLYFEIYVSDKFGSETFAFGVQPAGLANTGVAGANGRVQYFDSGQLRQNSTYSNFAVGYTGGDRIGVGIKAVGGNTQVHIWKNGRYLGLMFTISGVPSLEPILNAYHNGNNTSLEGGAVEIQTHVALPVGYSRWHEPPADGQIWRIQAASSQAFQGASEIEMRSVIGGADLCTGGSAQSYSIYSGSYAAANAFDDNTATLYHSDSHGILNFIQYTFAAPVADIVQLAIRARSDGENGIAPRDFDVRKWDGSAFVTQWTVRGTPVYANGEQKIFTKPA